MNSRRTIFLIITLLILFGTTFVVFKNIHDNKIKRYEEIKENVKKEAITYLTLMQSTKYVKEKYLYEDDIVNPSKRGASKNIILDVDGISYCKVAIKGYVKDDTWDANVYLKCKEYEDKSYENTILMYMCTNGVPKGYEEYYEKYDIEYDNFVCPIDID